MHIVPNAQTQGGDLLSQLIKAIDEIDEVNNDHAFLTILYAIATSPQFTMDDDLHRLLAAYLDTEPRKKLDAISANLMTIVKAMRDRR